MSTQRGSLLRRAVRLADAWAAPHGIDRYVELVAPTWSSTEVRGRIVAVDRTEAGDAVVLTVRPNANWSGFRPGQHIQVSVEIEGVRHTRCYSMASSAASTDTFQLGIKAHPHGLVSQHLVANAAVGDVLGLTPARGEFHLPDARPEHLLLVSGGSGITPVLSMLRTLCTEGHTGRVTFVHYARTPAQQLFRHELTALALAHPNVRVVLGYELEPDAGQLAGLFDTSHLDLADPDWREATAYVCGPAPLMDAVRDAYEGIGAGDRFHHEAFTLPAFIGEAGAVGGSVRFAGTDRTVEGDGSPLLVQAEAAGLTPESGCRMGICHTCTRSLTCGTVRDVVTGELTSADPTTGTGVDIRICVSAPVGDVEIDL